MDNKVKILMAALLKNQMKPYYLSSKDEVLPLVLTLINKGESVARGGSATLSQTGISDLLNNGDYVFIDPQKAGLTPEEKEDLIRKRFFADTFFTSSNAVITDGRLYNEDGASTRVAPLIYGPKQVIVIIGVNKIVDSIEEAAARIKLVAPINCKSIGLATPCATRGYCCECKSPQRSCCTTAIINFSRVPNRIKVIIVEDTLGI